MWPPTLTDCECYQPGWCERHQCLKTAHFHRLCRRNEKYYRLWEDGEGPCAPLPGEMIVDGRQPEEPGVLRKAVNYGKAVARHVADGAHKVDDETFESRKSVCLECSSCDTERLICLERACGCFIERKARWRSERCPLGKWSELPPENSAETSTATDADR